nr:MAG TPA: hypothetical protein [Caudoviricetes sp.]
MISSDVSDINVGDIIQKPFKRRLMLPICLIQPARRKNYHGRKC